MRAYFILPRDTDWNDRTVIYNNPGNYLNGDVRPFGCGFYIAALVAAKNYPRGKNPVALTDVIQQSKSQNIEFGFNEWHKAQTGKPMGQNWQTWSAANCVETRKTPFFDEIRSKYQ